MLLIYFTIVVISLIIIINIVNKKKGNFKKAILGNILSIFIVAFCFITLGFMPPIGRVLIFIILTFLISRYITLFMLKNKINPIIIATSVFIIIIFSITACYTQISPYAYMDNLSAANAYKDIWVVYLLIIISGLIIYGYTILKLLKKL